MNVPRSPARISYSQCWEDPETIRVALQVTHDDDVFIVTSGGCNALAVAVDGPRSVTAIDVNPAQNHLLELKQAAILTLSHSDLLGFLGVTGMRERGAPYAMLRDRLPAPCRAYWDSRPDEIGQGVIHVGRFERYLSVFRRFVLPAIHHRSKLEEALKAKTLDEQREFYHRVWDTLPWRALFRVAFCRPLLSRFGRYPGAFRHVELRDVASHYLGRVRHALTEIPVENNYFLEYMATGGYKNNLPFYLTTSASQALRSQSCQIRSVTADLLSFLRSIPAGTFSKFHFSDVFEYFDDAQYTDALRQVVRVSRPGARFCFYNNLVERPFPGPVQSVLQNDDRFARKLHQQDRSFVYRSFVVAKVNP